MRLGARFKAASIHLGICAVVALLVGGAIIGMWFPGQYAQLANGWHLLLIILGVDVVCGPLLTLVVYNPAKSKRELRTDLALVALLQLGALAYGVHVATQARPVLLAFEFDRFRVVSAAEIDPDRLPAAPPEFRSLSMTGPQIIGVRVPKNTDPDFGNAVDVALAGLDVTYRPQFWRPYDEQRSTVARQARHLSVLRAKYPEQAAAIDKLVAGSGQPETALGFIPAQNKRGDDWVVIVDKEQANVKGFVPVDGFFK
jgi:hypothetical protein